jgi:hypothetical protein
MLSSSTLVYERAVFEATNPGLSGYWQGVFPGEIPENPETPHRLDETTIELEGSDLEGIVSRMLELHSDRDNPRVVWHNAREAVKKREEGSLRP